MPFRAAGSLWGKWDLHFHTPSSFDYGNKSLTDSQIVESLIASGIVAVAVTDHHFIDASRIKNLQNIAKDKLTVFPAIELRSELGGKESVHLIGIFSESSDPEFIWTKLQGPLGITPKEVLTKGDENVYVRFEDASELIHDLGGVVSVHVGRKTNSLENIGNEHPYRRAFKKDLAREHIDLFEIGRKSDIKDYQQKIFPTINFERPLVICSDNHDVLKYAVKAWCWIKADPAFSAFQQVKSDPRERVYIGDLPPQMDRVQKNSTKYMKSISFRKVVNSHFDEDWFSGIVPLNPGLIAVIGNKGTGKTALAESIGLLGNTAQHGHFSFLHVDKFRQPKNNKARHFECRLDWENGHFCERLLSDSVDSETPESVGYIPQHYLEGICNEIQAPDSRFDRELKSVIFSHVDSAERLGAESLEELLKFRTEQTHARIDQLRLELSEINAKIVQLERQGSKENRQYLLNLEDEKRRELEAHDKLRPLEIIKPAADPSKQKQLEEIAANIQMKQNEKATLGADLKQRDSEVKVSAFRQAVAQRVCDRLRNFAAQYEKFISEATSDCIELKLSPTSLVKIEFDHLTPAAALEEASVAGETARSARINIKDQMAALQAEIEELTQRLDAPNVQYQSFLSQLEEWNQQRTIITGDEERTGSIRHIQKQIEDLTTVPPKISKLRSEREATVREVYKQLEQLVSNYKSLYSPVQKFIEEHALAAGKFSFEFEASVVCAGIEGGLFSYVNQGRKGSFCGADEGRKMLKGLTATADFNSENGTLSFANTLLDYMSHDKRDPGNPELLIWDQLRKDVEESELLNYIFSLRYLSPRYSLRWSGKNIEELSPGERGTLLLIFYLLIDRRDTPLIIDQPEENLDNQTVYELLVPCIKEARTKRQVIIVTHNPNLAVVCDADQVIYCTIDKHNKNKVTYTPGSLENPEINKFTIDVLEGTRPAFDHRDQKYQEAGNR